MSEFGEEDERKALAGTLWTNSLQHLALSGEGAHACSRHRCQQCDVLGVSVTTLRPRLDVSALFEQNR